jgi:hypothetical protein
MFVSGTCCFYAICRKNKEPTSGLEPLTPAPATSLLTRVLDCPTVSGNSACLGGFLSSGGVTLSSVYQCVSARLQHGCSKVIRPDSDR